MSLRTAFALACVAGCVACRPDAAPPTATPAEEPRATPALHTGPLTDYVAAAGLRWLIVVRPEALTGDPRLRSFRDALIPEDGFDAFAASTGVDLRRTETAVVAGYDYATLYVAEVKGPTARAGKRFEQRFLTVADRKTPHPSMWIVGGVVGRTPETMVGIDDRLVAVSVGDPQPATIVTLFALGKLERSPAALEGAALSTLPETIGDAPAVLYVTGPFEGAWARAGGGLLGAATALAIAAEPMDAKTLTLTVWVAGDWRAAGPAAVTHLLDGWNGLADSGTGRLLGLHHPASAPVLSAGDDALKLRIEVRSDHVVDGLRAAVLADVREIMGLPADGQGPRSPAEPPEKSE